MELLHHISMGIGVMGAAVILYGVLKGLGQLVWVEVRSLTGQSVVLTRQEMRHALGYYLLLGLEFLIAADIIVTLMEPDMERLLILGAIVIVRTVISFSLQFELRHGRENGVATAPHSAAINPNPSPSP
jgi:uncharacterized membrane protein